MNRYPFQTIAHVLRHPFFLHFWSVKTFKNCEPNKKTHTLKISKMGKLIFHSLQNIVRHFEQKNKKRHFLRGGGRCAYR